ncbi:hypothetical protein P8629_10960 [Hydrogenovibrio sp. 3SP14C1]|uniref:hypothetical protein n=1 Tax=Hydrogenovibrio sp. 3SP14C1 TaxID=3038774 RepID=UPI002416372F|nr:hypothetical protein [Hydrogenovibrio sp. 3SP14C1]MDG4813527.1 hypothetical protein [Hydrogenovibrio sp. 3SP14C1]
MVRGIKITLLVTLMAGMFFVKGVQADSRIYPKEVVLGNPVTWILSGEDIESDYDKLDLSELKKQFVIYDINGHSDRLRIRLYPVSTGILKIPELKAGRLHVKPTTIKVLENPEVTVSWKAPKKTVFQNEIVLWSANLKADSASIGVENVLPENMPDLPYEWIGQADPQTQEGTFYGKKIILTSAVALNKTGVVSLTSPIIRVQNETNKRWVFVAPPVSVQVRSLPSYLPAVIPLGKVSVQNSFPAQLIVIGRLYNWYLHLNGENVSVSNLPNITNQLGKDTRIEWLTPNLKKHTIMTTAGLSSRVEIDQPFRVNHFGLTQLPAMRLTYFDVNTGKLEDQFAPAQTLIVIPLWLMIVFQGLLVVIGAVTLFALGLVAKASLAKYRLIIVLKKSNSTEAAWLAILHWSHQQLKPVKNNQAWPFSPADKSASSVLSQQSLGQWLERFESQYGQNADARRLVEVLNEQFYSQQHDPLLQVALKWAQSLPKLDWTRFQSR